MCHPKRDPAIKIESGASYEVFVNKYPNYGDAVRLVINVARWSGRDLLLADTDGYHPPEEIRRLAQAAYGTRHPLVLIKPYRSNIGIQSLLFTQFYSFLNGKNINDATGGFYRLSNGLLQRLPPLKARDMTINLEILGAAIRLKAMLFQYPYMPGRNDAAHSKRPKNYQYKLLRRTLRDRFC
jgi:hypothetical protein